MNTQSPQDDQLSQVTRQQNLRKALRWAIGIHVVIFLVSVLGFPFFRSEKVDLSTAVQVDLVAPTDAFSRATDSSKSKEPCKTHANPEEKKKGVKADTKKAHDPVKTDAAKKDPVKKPKEQKHEK